MSRIATVFGGTGFIGKHLVQSLAREGWRIRAVCRHEKHASRLQPLGSVGQIAAFRGDVAQEDDVARAVEGADVVINLAGLLFESKKQTFTRVHEQGAANVAAACAKNGVQKLVHVSAAGISASSEAKYALSKAAGERATFASFPTAHVLRPSVIFGPEDRFFNFFASIFRFSPVFPIFFGGKTRFQPVYVMDVVQAVLACLEGKARAGEIYELGGPEDVSLRDVLSYIAKIIRRQVFFLPVSSGIGQFAASVLQLFPRPLLTVDQVRLLEQDAVVGSEALKEGRTFSGLSIQPVSYKLIVPEYLRKYEK